MDAGLLIDLREASLGSAGAGPEEEIRRLIGEWEQALCRRDLERLMAFYGREIVLFDVHPPFRAAGLSAVRELWEGSLVLFPEAFRIEKRDLRIEAEAGAAFAHWLFRLTGCPAGHPAAQVWMRVSAGYRKQPGGWKIIHEHVSVPVDPFSHRADFAPEV